MLPGCAGAMQPSACSGDGADVSSSLAVVALCVAVSASCRRANTLGAVSGLRAALRDPAVFVVIAVGIVAAAAVAMLITRGPAPIDAVAGRPGFVATNTVMPTTGPGQDGLLVGRKFPAYTGVSLKGKPLTVVDTAIVAVVIWSTDCDCVAMLRDVNEAIRKTAGQYTWVGIVISDDLGAAVSAASKGNLAFESGSDGGRVVRDFLGKKVGPMVLIVDSGTIVAQFTPGDITEARLVNALKEAA